MTLLKFLGIREYSQISDENVPKDNPCIESKSRSVSNTTSGFMMKFHGANTKKFHAAGNYFAIKPFHERFGTFAGAMIKDKNNVVWLRNRIGFNQKIRSKPKYNNLPQPTLLIGYFQ